MNLLDIFYQNVIIFKHLRRINNKFKFKQKIKIKDLLFPFTWQEDPNKKDIHYNITIQNNIYSRIGIYKEIIKYIKKTKRFNNKKVIIKSKSNKNDNYNQ